VGELCALTWGDVNFAEETLRVTAATAKTKRARWAPVPPALLDDLADLLPVEDRRADRRVFGDATPGAARGQMAAALRAAGRPHFSPHTFRHRRASLWHAQNVPERLIQEWGGWASAKVLTDLYRHVVIDPADDDWYGEAHRRMRVMADRAANPTGGVDTRERV
ncbi:MAG TPA: tyrosine-type recombinase/integrase, partial [Egibacteraceae bacterium]|nr:tyrosine-type recombinase/integrase [Egibacteraceae bacterium]